MDLTRDRARSLLALSVTLAGVMGTLAGCKPDLGAPISLIQGPRLLAVRGTPPEAKEGAPVSYDLLAVDVGGTIAAPAVRDQRRQRSLHRHPR